MASEPPVPDTSAEEAQGIIRAMVWRGQQAYGDSNTYTHELFRVLMATAVAAGKRFDDLRPFRINFRDYLGFQPDSNRFAAISRIEVEWRCRPGVVVHGTGEFAGFWQFVAAADGAIMASHNGQPCEEFQGLEGPELVQAVVASVFVEPHQVARRPRRRLWFTRGRRGRYV